MTVMPDPPTPSYIVTLTEELIRARAAAIEQACEQALAGGQYGVLVINGPTYFMAKVDSSVPYGEIHEKGSLS